MPNEAQRPLVPGAARPPVRPLAMQLLVRWPRISTATYTSRYVVPGTTGDGRLRRSSTWTESSVPPQSRTERCGCEANRTSRALTEARRMMSGAVPIRCPVALLRAFVLSVGGGRRERESAPRETSVPGPEVGHAGIVGDTSVLTCARA